jgi:hypothetical protein
MITKSLVYTLALMAAATGAVAAQEPDEHAAHHPPGQTATEPAPPKPSAEPKDPAQASMQEGMKNMQALMSAIESTKDPAARQKLLDQHRQAMREQMEAMRKMGGGMNAGTTGKGMMSGDMMKCHEVMTGRMEMMQMMMEQMMRHEDAQR